MTITQRIKRLEAELETLKKEHESELELVGGDGYIIFTSSEFNKTDRRDTSNAVQRGAFRATKELAEIADKNMVVRNKLEAFAMQLDPEWRDEGIPNTAYHMLKGQSSYFTGCVQAVRAVGTVYMSKETAETICEKLNSEEITLEA